MTKTSIIAALAILLATIATPAQAEPLSVTTRLLVEQRVADADGSTRIRLVEPRNVVPGDQVVVVLGYRNTGTQPIADLALTSPVPAGTAFAALRDGSPDAELSVDGRSYAPLAQLRVSLPGGGTRPAAAADITHVRWRLAAPVAPDARGERAFQAVLK